MKKFIFSILVTFFLITPLVVGAIEFRPPIATTSLYDILNLIKSISLSIVLPMAIIAVLFAAFMILRSQGVPEQIQKGKQILTYGLIGLAVVIFGAGSSALLINVFGLQEVPGLTSPLPIEESFLAMTNYLENPEALNNPVLKTVAEIQSQVKQCCIK